MPDLPELPNSTKRMLALQWSKLLEDHYLTGEHFEWVNAERDRLRRIAAQASPTARGQSRAPSLDSWELSRGIEPSVQVAKAHFTTAVKEYWPLWVSSGAGHEVFADWLPELQRRTLSDMPSVWKGRSVAIDRWYEEECGPAVEKALSTLVQEWARRARDEELKRLGREAFVRRVTALTRVEDRPKAEHAGATEPSGDEPTRMEAGPPAPAPDGTVSVRSPKDEFAEYQAATERDGTKISKYAVYTAKNRPASKPEFYDWYNGKLPADHLTSKRIVAFLRRREFPIPRNA